MKSLRESKRWFLRKCI